MRHQLLLVVLLAACAGDNKVGVYNTPPTVSITSPPDGTTANEATQIDFTALVKDGTTDPSEVMLQWSSDVDGVLTDTVRADTSGVALFSTAALTVGNHTITLAATDPEGQQSNAAIGITILDVPDNPTIQVVHPTAGESGIEGQPFEFVVQVADEQQAPETLRVDFASDVDGTFCSPTPDTLGVARCEAALTAVDHRLSFTVTDSEGLTAVAEYVFTVVSGQVIDDDGDAWTEAQGDCNDGDASVSPAATEYYNGRDDDCDGLVDDGTVGYDDDGDGQNEIDGDCDDADVTTYRGGVETCDGADNDCDGTIDETTNCYDDDGDGLAEIAGDCNDAAATTYPGAAELPDAADNDCDGTVDEGTVNYDDDGDGRTEVGGDCDDTRASVYTGATETCDGVDNDCDGTADEENATGCSMYYYDYDGDLYGSSSVGGRCLCAASSATYYTAVVNTDCYDFNASANPAASSYYTGSRGDGSYDYNCDGSQSQQYTSTASCGYSLGDCFASVSGWNGSVASCGTTAGWATGTDGCSYSWSRFSCYVSPNTSQTQACK
jgi:hypothetical protein